MLYNVIAYHRIKLRHQHCNIQPFLLICRHIAKLNRMDNSFLELRIYNHNIYLIYLFLDLQNMFSTLFHFHHKHDKTY
uniref:Uncharacterized protein n=1 Tax=Podoviridae sp. ctZkC8 TaxID=2825259 RepID=A0A8S5UBS7_9CAUD|nr:MAG TPA: hypothetical protein [Podoviridae sp. ctZkC8]